MLAVKSYFDFSEPQFFLSTSMVGTVGITLKGCCEKCCVCGNCHLQIWLINLLSTCFPVALHF